MSHNVKILPGATVCEDCTLVGDITIGGGTVIHPRATIIAEGGPIIIAEYCIVEEYATIIHKAAKPEEGASGESKEGGQEAAPLLIGAHNVFECKSVVGEDVRVSSGCVIGAGVTLRCRQSLPEQTVVWGAERHCRQAIDKQPSQLLQLDFLSKVMPNYHRLRKANLHTKRHAK